MRRWISVHDDCHCCSRDELSQLSFDIRAKERRRPSV
jgi:hypothetical protein